MRTKTTIALYMFLGACAVQTKTVAPVCYAVAVHAYRNEELNAIIDAFTLARCGQIWIGTDGVAKGFVTDTMLIAKTLREVTNDIIITKCAKQKHY